MIGERIKKLRLQKGYSITELAELASVSKSYLSYIERNLQNNPSLQVLSRLAAPLNTSIDYLLGGESVLKADTDRGLNKEWKDLIERTLSEGVMNGEFEVVRATKPSSSKKKPPRAVEKASNIIILHIDY